MDELKDFKAKFTQSEWFYGKVFVCLIALCFIGIIVMSILGAKNFSFHLISLEVGWTAKLWSVLFMALNSLIFFIMGVIFGRLRIEGKE